MKTLFLKNKDLRDQWQAVAKADWFSEVLTHARSELMAMANLNTDQLKGAMAMENTLLHLGDDEPEEVAYPGTGIDHDLEVTKNTSTKKK